MSQYDKTNPIVPTGTSGATLAALIDSLADHVMSGGSGTDIPTEAFEGLIATWDEGSGVFSPYILIGGDRKRIFHRENLIGSVSADGSGNNVGRVVQVLESGGTFGVKLAGGLALCMARLNNHAGGSETWNLPITFTDTAKMFAVGAAEASASARFPTLDPLSTTSVLVSCWTDTGAASSAVVNALVAGYWTEEHV